MANEIQASQAKELRNQLLSICDRLQKGASQTELYKGQLTTELNNRAAVKAAEFVRKYGQANFSKEDIRELERLFIIPVEDKQYPFNGQTLKYWIYQYMKAASLTEYAQDVLLRDNLLATIETACADLKPLCGRFSAFISSRKKKQAASDAYEFLQNLQSSTFGVIAPRIIGEYEDLKTIDSTKAEQEYAKDKTAFDTTVFNLHPGSVDESEIEFPESLLSNEAPDMMEKLHTIQENTRKATTYKERYEDEIKKTVQSLIQERAYEALREIPVEEINREKRGYRIKALRDNGYNTIADVVAASVYNLESIYGISYESAWGIKHVADEIAKQASSSSKIQISSDNKTKRATAVVQALRKYRVAEPCFELSEEVGRKESTISSITQNIQPTLSYMNWIRAGQSEQSASQEAVKKLREFNQYYMQRNGAVNAFVNSIHTMPTPEEAWRDFDENSVSYFGIIEKIVPGVLGNDDTFYGLPEDLAKEIQDECFFPEGLKCTLRRYQEWGVKYILHQGKALLGDEMGLGKTVQAIATMVSLRNTGATHFLVVCPASVLMNWCREVRKHSLLSVVEIHGAGRTAALQSWLRNGGVAVTTYETTAYIKLPEGQKVHQLIVDEAHYIKNEKARRTKNVDEICRHSERILFMTGTALENNVDEMISLIKKLNTSVAYKIEGMKSLTRAPEFRTAVAPVYYRRKREDVLTELPEKTEQSEWCTMLPEERGKYEETLYSRNPMAVRRLSWNVGDYSKSSKAIRLKEIVEEAKEEERKVIVFSFFLETIRMVREMLGPICSEPINGSVSPARRQEIIDDFEKADPGAVLIAQIQSGGTGLNIQAASVVVICEPQVKPSIENQAISRAYRLGQTRKVLVYRLLCTDSVDERITSRLEEKQRVFDAFADKSVAAEESKNIDDKTMKNIIEEEIERINAAKGTKGKTAQAIDNSQP